MPQCEHLMLGIQRVPPTTAIKENICILPQNRPHMQIPKIYVHLAPTTSEKIKETTLKQDITYATKPKNAIPTPNEAPKIPVQDEEKIADLSFRRELQLTTLVLICFILAIVIPLSMIAVGAVYVTNCPLEQMIPIFLIVCGSAFLMSLYGLRKLASRRETEFDWTCYKITFWICVWLQLGWFIAGCFWIYGSYKPSYNESDKEAYCHKTLYQYAFWLVNSIVIALSISIIAFLAFLTCGKLKMPKGDINV